jgi:hypothetical protein
VNDPTQRTDQEHDVIAESTRDGVVPDPAAASTLRHRTTIRIQESLEHREADLGGVVKIDIGDELRCGSNAGQTELTHGVRERVRDDHSEATAGPFPWDAVHQAFVP